MAILRGLAPSAEAMPADADDETRELERARRAFLAAYHAARAGRPAAAAAAVVRPGDLAVPDLCHAPRPREEPRHGTGWSTRPGGGEHGYRQGNRACDAATNPRGDPRRVAASEAGGRPALPGAAQPRLGVNLRGLHKPCAKRRGCGH